MRMGSLVGGILVLLLLGLLWFPLIFGGVGGFIAVFIIFILGIALVINGCRASEKDGLEKEKLKFKIRKLKKKKSSKKK